MSAHSPFPITIRRATPSDIPALVTLILTSFRQIPTFQALHTPLLTKKSFAHDTVYFWRRRLLLAILDSDTNLDVVEVRKDDLTNFDEEDGGRVFGKDIEGEDHWRQGWNWLFWCRVHAGLSQISSVDSGKVIVGVAGWRIQRGLESQQRGMSAVGWVGWMRGEFSVSSALYFSKLQFGHHGRSLPLSKSTME
jgi:hypothetical protein